MNTPRLQAALVLLLGAIVLCGAASLRGTEYDEQYTVFLLAGDARPAWPGSVFAVGSVRDRFHGDASPMHIAEDLRDGDVHPPLYFWVVDAWGHAVGDSLLRLRLLSVLFSLGALATVGLIARRLGVPVALAMLLTLGCYAFAYTGSVARGFALAQLLSLVGVLSALPGSRTKPMGAGLLLGAASFANYLAAFTAVPVIIWLACRRLRDGLGAAVGLAAFVAADLVFFLAQHGSRTDQFPPFLLANGLTRLAKYGAASLAGGLPLYVPDAFTNQVSTAIVIVLAGLALLVMVRWRHIASPAGRAFLAGCAVATPIGLLLLGLIFDNTPIELRYLAFSMPFVALLLAGALASLPRWAGVAFGGVALALQAAAIGGLVLCPQTMQPMRDAAREAAARADTQTVVLLPHGVDGVGLVGAFVTEAPDRLRIMLVDRDTRPAALQGVAPQLALALLDRDADSHATLAALLAGFADDPCWRALPGGSNLIVFQTSCGDAPWVSSTASR
jgi:hypothetical protein